MKDVMLEFTRLLKKRRTSVQEEPLLCTDFYPDARTIDLRHVSDAIILQFVAENAFSGNFTRLLRFLNIDTPNSTGQLPFSPAEVDHRLERADRAMRRLMGQQCLREIIISGLHGQLGTVSSVPVVPAAFGLAFILALWPAHETDEEYQRSVLIPVVLATHALLTANRGAVAVLTASMSVLPPRSLRRIVFACRHYITLFYVLLGAAQPTAPNDILLLESVCQLERCVFAAVRHAQYPSFGAVDVREFYADGVNQCANLTHEFSRFLRDKSSLFEYPFLVSVENKIKLMLLHARVLQEHGQESQPLRLEVQRNDRILDQVLARVSSYAAQVRRRGGQYGYRNPFHGQLRVNFIGEEAVDAGGVTRELFSLLTHQLFDPQFGLFTLTEDQRFVLFNTSGLGSPIHYQLIGILTGLALFNGLLLDVQFPIWVYRRLLGDPPCLQDLSDFEPVLYTSLKSLLEFKETPESGSVEDVFCLDFSLSEINCFGDTVTVELCEGGRDRCVTAENRREFVDLVVQHKVGTGVQRVFRNFADGFKLVAQVPALRFFSPEELESAIVGSQNYDWNVLREASQPRYGYTEDSPQVQWLWEVVVNEFTEEERINFLQFVTGSNRVPVGGLGQVHMGIVLQGRVDQLPTAHTCFYVLCLPPYTSKEQLAEKLRTAIQFCTGFGFI